MKKLFYIILLVVVFGCTLSAFAGSLVSLAETTSSGNVFDDLSRDENFDFSQYPTSSTGRDLSLITIAETSDSRLVLYVYQPYTAKTYYANSVRMSDELDDDVFVNTNDYALECVSRRGVFYKYVVKGYQVSSASVRHYNIIQLSRKYIRGVDEQSYVDVTINSVPFKVGKQFTFEVVNGQLVNTEKGIDVVTITNKYVGYVDVHSWVSENLGLTGESHALMQDSYFIAFTCDYDIDRLIEAEVSYYRQDVTKAKGETRYRFGTPVKEYVFLSDQRTFTVEKDFGYWDSYFKKYRPNTSTYTWNEIQTSADFLESVEAEDVYEGFALNSISWNKVNDNSRAIIEGMDWVLNFAQTSSVFYPKFNEVYPNWNYYASSAVYDGEAISNATILQLYIEHEGKTYQLGVVDGEMTTSGGPINEGGSAVEPNETGNVLRAILLLVGVIGLGLAAFWVVTKVVDMVKSKRK